MANPEIPLAAATTKRLPPHFFTPDIVAFGSIADRNRANTIQVGEFVFDPNRDFYGYWKKLLSANTPLLPPTDICLTHLHADHRQGLILYLKLVLSFGYSCTIWAPPHSRESTADADGFISGAVYYPGFPSNPITFDQEFGVRNTISHGQFSVTCHPLPHGHIENQAVYLVTGIDPPNQSILVCGDALKGLYDPRTKKSCFPAFYDNRQTLLSLARSHNALLFEGHGAYFHLSAFDEIESQVANSPQTISDLPPGPFLGTLTT